MVVFLILFIQVNASITQLYQLKKELINLSQIEAQNVTAPFWLKITEELDRGFKDEAGINAGLFKFLGKRFAKMLLKPLVESKEDLTSVTIFDAKDKEITTIGTKHNFIEDNSFVSHLPNPKSQSAIHEYSHVIVSIPYFYADNFGGRMVVAYSDHKMKEKQKKALLMNIAALVFYVFLGSIGIYWISRTITNPIHQISKTFKVISEGDLDAPIDTSRKDELSGLTKSFSSMRDSIRKWINNLTQLGEISDTLVAINNQSELFERVLQEIMGQYGFKIGTAYLINGDQFNKIIVLNKTEESDTLEFNKSFLDGLVSKEEISYFEDISDIEDFKNSPYKESSLLSLPIVDQDQAMGIMLFYGPSNEVSFIKDEQEFVSNLSRMTMLNVKNIKMLEVIEEYNRTLEQKVEERTKQLQKKTNDMANLLQHMHQGVFAILEDQTIHPEYSKHLEDILETDDIAGKSALEILFKRCDLGSNALDQIHNALNCIIGEDVLMYDFNSGLLVNEVTLKISDNKHKIVEAYWDPIINENDEVEKLLVTVRDVTELRALQLKAEAQKRELNIIGQILKVSVNNFNNFTKTSYEYLDENIETLKKNPEKNKDVIGLLFRNLHTIKGNARCYGFNYLTDIIHETENIYSQLLKDMDLEWDPEELLTQLEASKNAILEHESICKKWLGNEVEDTLDKFNTQVVDNARSKINSFEDKSNNIEQLKTLVMEVKKTLDGYDSEKLSDILKDIIDSTDSIAEKIGKLKPNVEINDHGFRFKPEIVSPLQDVSNHIFRNAVDHGLETTENRIKSGKSEKGTIFINLHAEDNYLVLDITDDGKGLALQKIKEKAIKNELLSEDSKITNTEIANLIFQAGFSTAESVSDVSGRGVGMEAVKLLLQKYGGDFNIILHEEIKADKGYSAFTSRITLPLSLIFDPSNYETTEIKNSQLLG